MDRILDSSRKAILLHFLHHIKLIQKPYIQFNQSQFTTTYYLNIIASNQFFYEQCKNIKLIYLIIDSILRQGLIYRDSIFDGFFSILLAIIKLLICKRAAFVMKIVCNLISRMDTFTNKQIWQHKLMRKAQILKNIVSAIPKNIFFVQSSKLIIFNTDKPYILMSVQVGVRVRPFNKRQQQLGSRLCVQMEGKTTYLVDSQGQKKPFHYDYSFWSHDSFRIDQQGYTHPIDDKYADQRKVYQLIGSSILTNAWEGYNCCLFAYGQTGSGKSYSMIGYGANKGLIPIVCNSIFQKIHNNQDGTRSFEVKVSMLQIYNEAVRDLLTKNKKQQLKICEHKTLGVYVDGLQKHSVDSYEKIQKKIEQGSNNRSIASTLMNQSSSRSHTIVSINFVQKIQISMEQTSVKYSMIHLVDLAGSQCVAKTGVDSKDRLRETAKINQSLTTLGRVIEILAQNCNKKQKDKQFVPYRDSKLTFILRSALGGNSRTAMICAISPSDDNYQQTLSTLRYASRAKKIQNKATVNESDVDKLIRLLREENQMLKKMLQEAKTNKIAVNQEMISNFNQTKKMIDLAVQVQDNDNANKVQQQKFLQELQKEALELQQNNTSSTSVNDSFSILQQINGVNQNLPYLTNVSQDQLLSFRIKYSCERLYIGNKKGNPRPDVVLTSLGIQPNHAFISYDSQLKKCFIEILQQNAVNYTFINGHTISVRTKEQIFHLDRIVFGTGCLFILIFKGSQPRSQIKLQDIDYQFAMNQMQTSNDKNTPSLVDERNVLEEQQLRKKIVEEIQKDFSNIKKQKEQQMKRQIQEKQKQYFSKIKQIQQTKEKQAKKLLDELQAKKKESLSLENEKKNIKEQVEKIINETKQIQKRSQIEKKQLQATKSVLQLKQKQIQQLQKKMQAIKVQTQQKTKLVKIQIKKQQQQVKKQLQIQTIMCHNSNIITQYQLQVNKRTKNAKQIKDILVKKQKIQLQRQLIELVPQVERFNLMAKEMNKHIQCGLSIQYKYISQAQILEVIKNNTYKSKLRILIHVINRDQGRSYYWDTSIFKNRFEHALQYFQNFIKNANFKYIKQQDPFWDPQKFETIAHTHLTLQFLMFNISYSGYISIICHGKKIGKMKAVLYQTDQNGLQNICFDIKKDDSYQNKIINPHDQIEKTIYFALELSQIEIVQGQLQDYDLMKLQYFLLDNYKMVKHETDIIMKDHLPHFKYKKLHIIRQLSQATIMHYLQKPLAIDLQVIQKVSITDQLTHRSSITSASNIRSSFSIQLQQQSKGNTSQNIVITQFIEVSPPRKSGNITISSSSPARGSPIIPALSGGIYQNTQITKKVQDQYRKKKQEEQTLQANMKKRQGRGSFVADTTKEHKGGKNPKECQIY